MRNFKGVLNSFFARLYLFLFFVNSYILQVKLTASFKRMANKENGKWINRLKGKVSNYLDTVGEKNF